MPSNKDQTHLRIFRGTLAQLPARRDLGLMLVSGITLNLLLAQIPATTLADMSAPKNGPSLALLVVCGLATLSPSVSGFLGARPVRRPARVPLPRKSARLWVGRMTVRPVWLALFVCLLYPYPLVWLVVTTLSIFASLASNAARNENARSEVLRLLGFAVEKNTPSSDSSDQSDTRKVHKGLLSVVALALAIAVMSQAGAAWNQGLPIPQALYQCPLYLLVLGWFLVNRERAAPRIQETTR